MSDFTKAYDPSVDLILSVMQYMQSSDRAILLKEIEKRYAPLRVMAKDVHQNSYDKGFWGPTSKNSDNWHLRAVDQIPMKLALIHSEASEALEECRMDPFNPNYVRIATNSKPEGFPIELADIVIRVMDLAEAFGIDLNESVRAKHEFNLTRPKMHGKRF